jgi:hypothetical protein
MKKLFATLLLSGATATLLSANNDTNWTKQFGTSSYDFGYSVATDSSGNVFVAGLTQGSLLGLNLGSSDVFLTKYDGAGNEIWKKQFGTSDADFGRSVATDSSGNVFVAGRTIGSLSGTNSGSSDVFVKKYSSNGNEIWAKQFGTSDADFGRSVATDSSGNIFVTGSTRGSLSGSNLGSDDIFLTKYDGAGNEIWTKQFGTSDTDQGNSVATDSSGNIFVIGTTSGSLSGSNFGYSDIFLTKYDSSGNEIWTKQFGTSSNDEGNSVATDSSGNIFVIGTTSGSLSGSNLGSADIFLTKYDGAGNEIWTKQFGTSDTDQGNSVATDSSGNVFVAGRTYGSLSGSNLGSADIFLTKHDGAGNEIWIKQFGTSSDDYQAVGGASAISGNSIFLTGFTYGSFDGFSNSGYKDVFLSRFSIENETLLEIQSGWNLVALDINLSEINSDISIIWQFENEIWSAFSPNGKYTFAISENGINEISENLKSENGTWFLSEKNTTLEKESSDENSTFDLVSGWNLVGTSKTIPASDVKCENSDSVMIWKYSDETWKLFVDGIGISEYPHMFDTIFANEGFWVKCK